MQAYGHFVQESATLDSKSYRKNLGRDKISILGSRSEAERGDRGMKGEHGTNLLDRKLILKIREQTENASVQA